MNLGTMMAIIASRLREDNDTRAGGDPFGRRDVCYEAANELAHNKNFYTNRRGNFEAGVSNYCLPEIFQLDAVNLTSDTGEMYAPARVLRGASAARQYLPPDWERQTGVTNPDTVIFYGQNAVGFYRKPLAARTGAFTLWGWGIPGEAWAYTLDTTTGLYEPNHDPRTKCPLPETDHPAVLSLALAKRAMTDERAEIRAMYPELMRTANYQRGDVYRDAINYSARIRGEGLTGVLGSW